MLYLLVVEHGFDPRQPVERRSTPDPVQQAPLVHTLQIAPHRGARHPQRLGEFRHFQYRRLSKQLQDASFSFRCDEPIFRHQSTPSLKYRRFRERLYFIHSPPVCPPKFLKKSPKTSKSVQKSTRKTENRNPK